jgi:hypothetical protein
VPPWFGASRDCDRQIPQLDAPGDFAWQLREFLSAASFIAVTTEHADTDCLIWLTQSPGDAGQRALCALW